MSDHTHVQICGAGAHACSTFRERHSGQLQVRHCVYAWNAGGDAATKQEGKASGEGGVRDKSSEAGRSAGVVQATTATRQKPRALAKRRRG